MAATAYSVALLGGARLPAATGNAAPRSSAFLPRRNLHPLRLQGAHAYAPRPSLLRVKAASDDTSASGDEIIEDLKGKWEAIEDKPTFLLYSGGAVVALWLTTVVVGAINSVPLAPQAPGAGWARLHRVVRVPLPPLQGKQERVGHRHRKLEEEDCRNRINSSSLERFRWLFCLSM
uniref:Cyanobacterial aminoacyl-tRNA synthetase CAAD domain-containing protein n=1 Tax=Aegilops tauschii subsp. strangulata TaxID=200361 RepID=A0A453RAX0_AEGTS